MGLNSLGIVPISSFICDFRLAFQNIEPYRLVTGFLVPNPQPMQGLLETYMLYTFSKGLESGKFSGNTSDYLYYLLIISPIMLLSAYFILPPVYSLFPALLSALTFSWAINNYDQNINFYFIPMKASLLPITTLAFRFLVEGKLSFTISIIGTAAAYIYNCMETHSFGPLSSLFLTNTGNNFTRWPYATGHLSAPGWLRTIVSKLRGAVGPSGVHTIAPTSSNKKKAKRNSAFQGEGHRLGTKED